MKIRYPSVEGMFYPSDPEELDKMLKSFDTNVPDYKGPRPCALIVPHAGLVYSGQTAAFAYKTASLFGYKDVAVFAPSHRVAFYGISASPYEKYSFCGRDIIVNRDLTDKTACSNRMIVKEEAHLSEHSTEVQLPFIYKYLNGCRISIFVYSETDPVKLSYAVSELARNKDNLVIISTDLSHFHPYDECRRIDSKVIEGIKDLDTELISKGEACGMKGIQAVVHSAKCLKLVPEILDYKNSGDVSGDRSSVVGYLSVLFYREQE